MAEKTVDDAAGKQAQENDSYLSDHTIAMRKVVVEYCQQFQRSKERQCDHLLNQLNARQHGMASNLAQIRKEAYQEFWNQNPPVVETIDCTAITPQEFRIQFHHRNIPCILRGLDQTSFRSVMDQWLHPDGTIHREWFRQELGAETVVPLRQSAKGDLDEDGRAMECRTKHVPLQEWIEYLIHVKDQEELWYLKDWHLLQELLGHAVASKRSKQNLYHCPEYFQYDLLNNMLVKCTKGDYRFCYWGPSNSNTTRHSDVLHSFSWSFTISGTKQWTFYGPNKTLTCLQGEGETMFVPSTWQHDVINLQETLSINHNWITTAIIDETWNCLQVEITAIKKELGAWGIGESSWSSQENMLRGCVGLDVTAFFLMNLMRLVELLSTTCHSDHQDEWSFDTYRLVAMLEVMIKDHDLHLQDRLSSVLESEDYAKIAYNTATEALDLVRTFQ